MTDPEYQNKTYEEIVEVMRARALTLYYIFKYLKGVHNG